MSAAARDIMEGAVRRELVGPPAGEPPRGAPLDTSGPIHFESNVAAAGPFHDGATGEEILTNSPLRRYGVGILFPGGRDPDRMPGVSGLSESDEEEVEFEPSAIVAEPVQPFAEAEDYDFDLSAANDYEQSAMAVTFLAHVPEGSSLKIVGDTARYARLVVTTADQRRDREWWVRRPFGFSGTVARSAFRTSGPTMLDVPLVISADNGALLGCVVYARPLAGATDPDQWIITVAMRNRATQGGAASAFLQVNFGVELHSGALVMPYPESKNGARDLDEESLELLYRHQQTFAIGHGCAANWVKDSDGFVRRVSSEVMPSYTVPSLTPVVHYEDSSGNRQQLSVGMKALAEGSVEGSEAVELLLRFYQEWIDRLKEESHTLSERHQDAASRHIEACEQALRRMRAGWSLVTADGSAQTAFRLMNLAMIDQQRRSRLPRRDVHIASDGTVRVDGSHPDISAQPDKEAWRPFQIGFILSVIPELVDKSLSERAVVDLIFFPTGGGKTEAYLGAASMSMLLRRLADPSDDGTDVLMRYTLRLLTSQQFRRAASLLCVLEDIRARAMDEWHLDLGAAPFSIGIWLGGSTTPNSWSAALTALGKLESDVNAKNPFLLLRCPWCGAQMGPVQLPGRHGKRAAVGYARKGRESVYLVCPDAQCSFSEPRHLPVHVVDEDIYETSPTLVIGTVDKFAMLAWRPEARSMFGIGSDGTRRVSPPGLIIQDELHLISGPLGSMVSLYEPIIERLCISDSGPPKVIASTATIRNAGRQILDLYGRSHVALFPPHGLTQGRSFFAEPATHPDGSPVEGRRYLGVLSPSLGSMQTVQVRVAAATLQGALAIPEGERDGYWTNLNFLNSLRELGNTVSLLQSDIRGYLTGVRRRDGAEQIRWPRNTMELTSRRENDEIPQAIEELEVKYPGKQCVDVCLASNIIEVGVDIDRLSLMTIVGQPKTTAQYIQVSGRVGRQDGRPGLVIVLYSASKPRDRSHYERFTGYHQRLYAQVEPTSLTPFARPVLQRGLHGAAVALIRQTGLQDEGPLPFPVDQYDEAVDLLRSRAALVDPDELTSLNDIAAMRRRQATAWQRTYWNGNQTWGHPEDGLMRFPGTPAIPGSLTWEVPSSMRSVDSECRLQITTAYLLDDAADGSSTP